MTTTQATTDRLIETLARPGHYTRTVGTLPGDLTPGSVLHDGVLPGTGLASVSRVERTGVTVTLHLNVLLADGTESDEEFVWHSTLPLGLLPGRTVTAVPYAEGGGYAASMNFHGSLRGCHGGLSLADAFDLVIF